jgi:glutathione S-transferase
LIFEQERVMSGIGGARFRTLTSRDVDVIPAKVQLANTALVMLEAHLQAAPYLVGASCSIADIANFAYTHVAGDAGLDLAQYPAISGWLRRITELPHYINDLVPYPANARPGTSRSIYDT